MSKLEELIKEIEESIGILTIYLNTKAGKEGENHWEYTSGYISGMKNVLWKLQYLEKYPNG